MCLVGASCGNEALPTTKAPEADDGNLSLAGQLQPGSYQVGFEKRVITLKESKDTEPGTAERTADLYLWYPAADEHSGNAITFADYYRVQETEEPDDATLREWLIADMTSPPDLRDDDPDRILSADMWARANANPLPGDFPLIMWSYRDSVPTMQAVLNEFLASHGYVVAFAWPRSDLPPFPWQEGLTQEQKTAALHLQVRFLELVLDQLEIPSANTRQTAVLSWSYGGESAHLLQRRRTQVKIAIGIDSTLVSGWIYETQEKLAAVSPDDLRVPHVLIKHGRPSLTADKTVEPDLLAQVPSGSWYATLPPLSHGNFNVPGGMVPGVIGLKEVSSWAVGGETARIGYEIVCQLTLHFLDMTFRSGDLQLPPWIDNLPPNSLEIVYHQSN